MVQKYQGTENKEQKQKLLLIMRSYDKNIPYTIEGVFRNECAMIDRAKHNGTLYRFQNASGEWSAIDPESVLLIAEEKQDEDQD